MTQELEMLRRIDGLENAVNVQRETIAVLTSTVAILLDHVEKFVVRINELQANLEQINTLINDVPEVNAEYDDYKDKGIPTMEFGTVDNKGV